MSVLYIQRPTLIGFGVRHESRRAKSVRLEPWTERRYIPI